MQEDQEIRMTKAHPGDTRTVNWEDVAVTLRAQLELLDAHHFWAASAYLDQAIEVIEKGIGMVRPAATRPCLEFDA